MTRRDQCARQHVQRKLIHDQNVGGLLPSILVRCKDGQHGGVCKKSHDSDDENENLEICAENGAVIADRVTFSRNATVDWEVFEVMSLKC